MRNKSRKYDNEYIISRDFSLIVRNACGWWVVEGGRKRVLFFEYPFNTIFVVISIYVLMCVCLVY